jgi:hypothetical protein
VDASAFAPFLLTISILMDIFHMVTLVEIDLILVTIEAIFIGIIIEFIVF